MQYFECFQIEILIFVAINVVNFTKDDLLEEVKFL